MSQRNKSVRRGPKRGALRTAIDRGYYISRRWRQLGPFTKEQLRGLHIKRNTLVWNPERWAWMRAEAVDALIDLFRPRGVIAWFKSLLADLRSPSADPRWVFNEDRPRSGRSPGPPLTR